MSETPATNTPTDPDCLFNARLHDVKDDGESLEGECSKCKFMVPLPDREWRLKIAELRGQLAERPATNTDTSNDTNCQCCGLPKGIMSGGCVARHKDGACERCNGASAPGEWYRVLQWASSRSYVTAGDYGGGQEAERDIQWAIEEALTAHDSLHTEVSALTEQLALEKTAEYNRYGDRYYCLICGHDCTSAAACARNNYGHQRTGSDDKPCTTCATAPTERIATLKSHVETSICTKCGWVGIPKAWPVQHATYPRHTDIQYACGREGCDYLVPKPQSARISDLASQLAEARAQIEADMTDTTEAELQLRVVQLESDLARVTRDLEVANDAFERLTQQNIAVTREWDKARKKASEQHRRAQKAEGALLRAQKKTDTWSSPERQREAQQRDQMMGVVARAEARDEAVRKTEERNGDV